MAERDKAGQSFSIKQWALDDRPREKLMKKGRGALSDAELVAILINSGTKKASAVQLAKEILRSVDHDLNRLGQLGLRELMKFPGIGEARALTILAALEIGRRRANTEGESVASITCSQDAFKVLFPYLADHNHEEFYILILNRANKVNDVVRISQGGVSGTVADPKMIFGSALERLASGIILAHNHPSGNLQPSTADKALTKRLVEAGKLLEINVLDHLIIAGSSYFSFADEGLI